MEVLINIAAVLAIIALLEIIIYTGMKIFDWVYCVYDILKEEKKYEWLLKGK